MRCVKETLPPRARARWLLITIRLSHSSFTGTVRTLVAVGTLRLTSMFCAVRMGAPRSTVSVGSSTASGRVVGGTSFGTGAALVGAAFAAAAFSGAAFSGAAFADAAFGAGFEGAGFAGAAWGALASVRAGAFTSPFEARAVDGAPLFDGTPFPRDRKNSHQARSTLSGSAWYRSYISSTSHSLAPKSAIGSAVVVGWLSCTGSATRPFASSAALASFASSKCLYKSRPSLVNTLGPVDLCGVVLLGQVPGRGRWVLCPCLVGSWEQPSRSPSRRGWPGAPTPRRRARLPRPWTPAVSLRRSGWRPASPASPATCRP